MNQTAVAVPGCQVIRRGAVGSTNDEAKKLAAGGCPDRTVIWATEQKQGKGRHGRSWESPPGNLYLSIVLRPNRPRNEAPQIGFVAALALAEAIDRLVPAAGRTVLLKWPNDVLIGGAKVSGILLESENGRDQERSWLVLGMGVNVATHPEDTDRPATSLRRAGYTGTLETLAQTLMERLVTWLNAWERDGFAEVREAWLKRAEVGKPISVRLGPQTLTGHFAGLDPRGALILAENGDTRVVTAGEVFETAG